jgi:hypothetical protein
MTRSASSGRNSMGKNGITLLASFLGLSIAGTAAADPRPVVVELFTSQGCSSCPPADELLGELATRPGVVALGFHISYWDRLGWKDPLSSEAATERQKRYARRLGDGRIYTPEIIVDGAADVVGSDREAVLAALRRAGEMHPAALAPVTFAADRHSVSIGGGAGKGEVLLVRFAQRRTTHIGAGENGGRVATDFNGVETLATLGTWDGAPRQFALTPPAPGEGLAVLVQAPDGRMLGAAMALGSASSSS